MTVGIFSWLSGLLLNCWILSVNTKDYRAGIRLSPCDQLLTLMGSANLVLQTALSADIVLLTFRSYSAYVTQVHRKILSVQMFLISLSLWLTVWLSVYYCLRIVNFTHGLLFTLKMRISAFLPRLLVFSVVHSFFIAIPSVWTISVKVLPSPFQNMTLNSTINRTDLSMDFHYFMVIFLGCIIPLSLTLIPIGATLRSLWKHTRRMKKNDFGRPQIQAHVTAARTMILLTILYVMFYVASISVLSCSFNIRSIEMHFSWFFIMFYPTTQSIVLIAGNSKLRKAAKSFQKQWTLTE
ncbi:taste receptor type 2 member 40-like [Spea bombifrons]|uniref:taste receptor type 2 member 40-like n=1 Tax=Spea bombifrons TaxID=233779 RepID=UPI00234AA652|nr:taste receptor type 2 member 40-like [Spea bombifrons]